MMGLCSPNQIDHELITRLINHEGIKTELYKDSNGWLTIGVGHLIDPAKSGKLTINACMFILNEDISIVRAELKPFNFYNKLDQVRQDMLVEMCFNIGINGILQFHDMIKSIDKNDFAQAAKDFLNSKEARQIHETRANDMAYRLQYGKYK